VLRAALEVAWVRTRRAHPRVEGVECWARFPPGRKRCAEAQRRLGVRDRLSSGRRGSAGVNPVEALAERARARAAASSARGGFGARRRDERVPPPPGRPFLMANVGSGANGFADVAAWLAEPTSHPDARVKMRVFSVHAEQHGPGNRRRCAAGSWPRAGWTLNLPT